MRSEIKDVGEIKNRFVEHLYFTLLEDRTYLKIIIKILA